MNLGELIQTSTAAIEAADASNLDVVWEKVKADIGEQSQGHESEHLGGRFRLLALQRLDPIYQARRAELGLP